MWDYMSGYINWLFTNVWLPMSLLTSDQDTMRSMNRLEESMPYSISGNDAWMRLLQGNQRFVSGDLASYLGWIAQGVSPTTRYYLTEGQAPYAVVLSCSDSRVDPSLIFDTGLGEIFGVRVAGNIVDPINMGSIEYATEHLHSPLLVILGHTSCGAVKAAIETEMAQPGISYLPYGGNYGYIPAVINSILPAAASTYTTDANLWLNNAIYQNVRNSKNTLLASSPSLDALVLAGKLKVVTAVYHLDSGVVEEFI